MAARKKRRTYKRQANDWYVEPSWCVDALIDVAPYFAGSLVFDPCCGLGTIPAAFAARGFDATGSDLVERPGLLIERTGFDFLRGESIPWVPEEVLAAHQLSIVMNPPYRHTEAFARRALAFASDAVAVLVPLNWLGSKKRFKLFSTCPPTLIAVFSQRPSMPPGDAIAVMGAKAFKGGKIDYCWVVWDKRAPAPQTRTIWLAPREAAHG